MIEQTLFSTHPFASTVLMAAVAVVMTAPRWARRVCNRAYWQEEMFEPVKIGGIPHLRVLHRGPQVGLIGEQPIFDWLEVEDAHGQRKTLRFTSANGLQNVPGMTVLRAGHVTYAEHVLPTPAPANVAVLRSQEEVS